MTTRGGPDKLRGGRRATTLAFVLIGNLWGSWAPHIALVKERLDRSAGILGLTLLATACGTLVAMPLAGGLIARFVAVLLVALLAPRLMRRMSPRGDRHPVSDRHDPTMRRCSLSGAQLRSKTRPTASVALASVRRRTLGRLASVSSIVSDGGKA